MSASCHTSRLCAKFCPTFACIYGFAEARTSKIRMCKSSLVWINCDSDKNLVCVGRFLSIGQLLTCRPVYTSQTLVVESLPPLTSNFFSFFEQSTVVTDFVCPCNSIQLSSGLAKSKILTIGSREHVATCSSPTMQHMLTISEEHSNERKCDICSFPRVFSSSWSASTSGETASKCTKVSAHTQKLFSSRQTMWLM